MCYNDGITLGKFLPSEASAMLGCPKLEFQAPVGAVYHEYYVSLSVATFTNMVNFNPSMDK